MYVTSQRADLSLFSFPMSSLPRDGDLTLLEYIVKVNVAQNRVTYIELLNWIKGPHKVSY